jgi:HlyD family secretion protein
MPVLLIVLALGAWYWWQQAAAQKQRVEYETEEIRRGNVTRTVTANGTLNPVTLVSVGTQVSGTVARIHADFNDEVKAGQILLELDPALFKAALAQSEANLARARAAWKLADANAARMRDLHRQEYVSRLELDQAEEALASARAQVELTRAQVSRDRTNLDYSVIRSPVSGTVIDRQVNEGQTVAASFQTPTLFKIGQDLTRMQIDTLVAEADVAGIREGMAVKFNVDAYPEEDFRGTVSQLRMNPTKEQNVVSYNVVVSVDNRDLKLLPGMTAIIDIAVESRRNVLLTPNAALRFRLPEANGAEAQPRARRKDRARGARVYKLVAGQPAEFQLKTGITDNKVTEIVSGDVKEGDRVVVRLNAGAAKKAEKDSGFRVQAF